MNNTYNISFISNACGVRPHTIRTWEKRYKAFSPDRTDGGQRIYSEDDLTKGRLIVSLLEQGHTISQLAGKSLEDLRTLVIDYKIELVGSRFVIDNPNAVSSCGCGTSFAI